MNKAELKPCPFCGDKNAFLENLYGSTFAVQCNACCAYGPTAEYADHKFAHRQAIKQWNKRAVNRQEGEA